MILARRLPALGVVCLSMWSGVAFASPSLRVVFPERSQPSRVAVRAGAGAGYDDNVRLLAPVEVLPDVPISDGFGAADAAVWLTPRQDGPVASGALQLRRFLAADNGVLGGGSARAGWRFELGPARLEPAVSFDAFAWSAFPSDRHLAVSFAPAFIVRRARLRLGIWPTVLARAFSDGTDKEVWVAASATWTAGAFDWTVGYDAGAVAASDPELGRTLHEAELEVAWRASSSFSAGVSGRMATKRLPSLPVADGVVGRSDRVATASTWARWRFARSFSLLGSFDAVLSRSSSPTADWSRLVGLVSVQWHWHRRPSKRRLSRPSVLVAQAPGAREVAVAGSFSDWQPWPMKPRGDGSFQLDVALAPGEHRVGLVIDGEWTVPEGLPTAMDDFGTREAVLAVGLE